MTRRDKYRDPSYFEKYISDQTARIDKFKKVLEECGESEKLRVYRFLSDRYKDLISAQFSYNEELTEILKSFKEYAIYISEAGFSCYSEYIDFVSLQIILDIKDILIDVPQEYNDDLAKILNGYLKGSDFELTGYLYESRYYSVFMDYCNDKLTFADLMNYVSNKWYTLSMGFYWFNSHEKDQDVYTGYWCYVASAAIRVKGDQSKINEGYPYII